VEELHLLCLRIAEMDLTGVPLDPRYLSLLELYSNGSTRNSAFPRLKMNETVSRIVRKFDPALLSRSPLLLSLMKHDPKVEDCYAALLIHCLRSPQSPSHSALLEHLLEIGVVRFLAEGLSLRGPVVAKQALVSLRKLVEVKSLTTVEEMPELSLPDELFPLILRDCSW
jgi:hypothetical protein